MAAFYEDGEYTKLSKLDTRILTVLLLGQNTGYGIARQCEADAGDNKLLSKGAFYRALKSLELVGFIQGREAGLTNSGQARKLYTITNSGRMVLDWETEALSKLVGMVKKRKSHP